MALCHGFWRGRRVFVTGHTGFKGSWLCHWLLAEGAEVVGLALPPPTEPALFTLLRLASRMQHRLGDIRDRETVQRAMAEARPEVVLHLAAQPLVRASYREPVPTWETNVLGTIQVLEAVRRTPSVRACLIITSDKCYENREWVWGYREEDAMGGHDPYSASKGAAELAVASWRRSFFAEPDACRIASARAGNVIGGGDWAADRLVTDLVTALRRGEPLRLRNPLATRPWQHVLEPLSGYLHLAWRLCQDDGQRFAEGWNFGPEDGSIITVRELAQRLIRAYGRGTIIEAQDPRQPHEAQWLKLDISKARARLGWFPIWDIDTTVQRTAGWYRAVDAGADAVALADADLHAYTTAARERGAPWMN